MYSPLQEVPSTPALLSHAGVLKRFAGTPEAVVPEVLIDHSQGRSFSVPGTPVSPAVRSSPWTPNVRSLARTQKSRRYTYNPSLTPRFVPKSPAGLATLKEQVVPSTPVGGFTLHNTPITKKGSTRFVTPKNEYNEDIVDAAGDRPRKRNKVRNEKKDYDHKTTPHLRSRSMREVVARFRRSPEATQGSGDAAVLHDFLDIIEPH